MTSLAFSHGAAVGNPSTSTGTSETVNESPGWKNRPPIRYPDSPATGIPDDPIAGSAHTALAPYWSSRLGRDTLDGLQASARTGLVRTAVRGNRVHLTGRAVTVLDGILRHHAERSTADIQA
jgi:predicted PhzF superfamily epimerase YddE/YHI9